MCPCLHKCTKEGMLAGQGEDNLLFSKPSQRPVFIFCLYVPVTFASLRKSARGSVNLTARDKTMCLRTLSRARAATELGLCRMRSRAHDCQARLQFCAKWDFSSFLDLEKNLQTLLEGSLGSAWESFHGRVHNNCPLH